MKGQVAVEGMLVIVVVAQDHLRSNKKKGRQRLLRRPRKVITRYDIVTSIVLTDIYGIRLTIASHLHRIAMCLLTQSYF